MAHEPKPGEQFAGRYRIERLLGRGATGAVWSALDEDVGDRVALKLLTAGPDDAPERFRREVRLARRVTHRNAARIFDLGTAEGVPYLTMELVEGESLHEILARSAPMAVVQAADIGSQIASGPALDSVLSCDSWRSRRSRCRDCSRAASHHSRRAGLRGHRLDGALPGARRSSKKLRLRPTARTGAEARQRDLARQRLLDSTEPGDLRERIRSSGLCIVPVGSPAALYDQRYVELLDALHLEAHEGGDLFGLLLRHFQHELVVHREQQRGLGEL